MDPKLVVSQVGPNAEALAITSIVLGSATGPPVVSSMSVTSVQGHTRDITAPNSQEHHGRPGIGIETIPGVETREPLTPNLPRESEAFTGSLPTPVNVDSLERVLVDHPDRLSCVYVTVLGMVQILDTRGPGFSGFLETYQQP